MTRSLLLIVTCAACLSLSTRSVQAVPSQLATPLLAKTGEPAKTPFWASPLFLGGLGATSIAGAVTAWVLKRKSIAENLSEQSRAIENLERSQSVVSSSNGTPDIRPELLPLTGNSQSETATQAGSGGMLQVVELPKAVSSLAIEETTRLAKINIVDELIQDLRSPDPAKRRKVIWELGQRGDTRAVQPLVDLLVESDSKQRSLVLSALSEIGTRTLKPMTRALAVSLQDENAEVRKNAIRDLTRVFDMVSQMSHLLHQATEDSDQEVQDTAKWALGQLNRIRSTPSEAPTLKNPESLP
ncbi:HEAT repeat domain-containing protein [Leptolyngbya sp. DQ-M1]|uniref:HEAT repeat domain-containing protein n=1 Tax=Leptolyngbya sp. DQ-M1 TaxID=2933920 RepID=UPI0032982464